jgi:hypothetical protein
MAARITKEGPMQSDWTISQLARHYGVPPRVISDLFYLRKLDDLRCPVFAGRRMIPNDYLPEIEKVLRQMGRLPATEASRA